MAVMPGWTPGNQGLESIESLDRRPYFQPLSNLVVTFGNIQPTHDLSQRAAFRLDSIPSAPTFVPSDVQPASPGQSGIRVSAINEWFMHLRRKLHRDRKRCRLSVASNEVYRQVQRRTNEVKAVFHLHQSCIPTLLCDFVKVVFHVL